MSGRRLLKLIAASFFVILFLTLSVTSIALSSSGIYVAHYSLAGRGSQPLLSSEGLRDSLKSFSSNSTLTTLEYSLRGSHEINATISISPSPSLSFKGAIARHEGAKQNGSIAIAPNQSGTLFSWRQGRTSVTGLLLSANLHYLSSGLVQQGYATFLISEDSSGFDRNRGKDVASLSQNVEMGLRTAQQFDPFVVDVLGPVLSYDQYVLPATSVTFFGIVAGMARSMDFSNARKFDNSLGLDEREFALLASLSALKGMFTGSDLLITNGVVHEWQTLSALLEKLSWLGIMERRIGTQGGSPRIFWKCVVA